MIIDADAHVVETTQTWSYLEGSDVKYRPQLFQSPENPNAQYWFLDGKVIGFRNPTLSERELEELSRETGRTLETAAEARELRDVELRLKHMDELGIDVQVLFNTLWIARVADRPEAEIALCGAWNRWMADIWRQGRGRLRWSCVVPAMTIPEALRQMRFARENGAVAVSLRPFEYEKHLVEPYFYPIYEEAARLDLAVAIHIANGSPVLLDYFKPRYDRMGGFAQFRIPTVVTCLSLMMSDVPKLFPRLRWGFIEASAQWVPWVVNEAIRRSGAKGFPKNPCREFKIYISAQTDDDFSYVLKYAGEDNIVIGTDYGHTDASSQVDAIEVFRGNPAVDEAAKKKILEDNPRALYNL
ncbi:MAG TPA: amidohydrolase family protein [candidate division Zixibacteria bacterium]|nr:amidohydrolase family protein [candidate division Zixibacteria bacterium]